jgi:hypothetical protein
MTTAARKQMRPIHPKKIESLPQPSPNNALHPTAAAPTVSFIILNLSSRACYLEPLARRLWVSLIR